MLATLLRSLSLTAILFLMVTTIIYWRAIARALYRARIVLCAALFLALVLFIAGCATPHRSSAASHTIKTYEGRCDGLVKCEEWKDKHSAGAIFFFSDPASQGFCDKYTNQSGIGGSSW